ncbi:MAG: hypothetical protein V1900_00115 [Candidatus Aenigmatarchaeota archaeon]
MEMQEVVVLIVIALVCLAVAMSIFGGRISADELKPSPLVNVVVVGKPDIDVSDKKIDDKYNYAVKFSGIVKYSGELKDTIDVIPLFSFKGVDEKAISDGNRFTLTPEKPSFDGLISAEILSSSPRIMKKGDYYKGRMKLHDSFLFSADGNFTVTLEKKDGCKAKFIVECMSDYRLFELEECKETNYDKCERYLDICKGTVHVKMFSCEEVEISVKGGEYYEAGDALDISFWKKTKCTEKEDEYKYLRSMCGRDFLGLHTFMIVPKA